MPAVVPRPSSSLGLHLGGRDPRDVPAAELRTASALARLDGLRTISDVAAEFGSARPLVELVLGRARDGGHATKPIIRLVGELLHHRLGVSVAAEALALARLAQPLVDPTSLEALFREAQRATCSLRPMGWAQRERFHAYLSVSSTPSIRRDLLIAAWRPESIAPLALLATPERFDVSWSGLNRSHGQFRSCWMGNDRYRSAAWAERERWIELGDPALWFTHCDMTDVVALLLADDRNAGWENPAHQLTDAEFTLALRVAPGMLLDHLRRLGDAGDLSNRIAYPSDAASDLLAVMAGPAHVDWARLRRRLTDASSDHLDWIFESAPVHLCAALNALDLLSVEWFSGGPLRRADLRDPWIVRALFGPPGARDHARTVSLVNDVRALSGVQFHEDLWHVISCAPLNSNAPLMIELARTASGEMLRWVGPLLDTLVVGAVDPADLPSEAGAWAGSTVRSIMPELAAADRPVRHPEIMRDVLNPARIGGDFNYPTVIKDLHHSTLADCPEWTIELPRNAAELRRNALEMRNCTASYVETVAGGGLVILRVVDASGACVYNAGLEWDRNGWSLFEVLSHGNGGNVPDRLFDALTALASGLPPDVMPE